MVRNWSARGFSPMKKALKVPFCFKEPSKTPDLELEPQLLGSQIRVMRR